MPTSAAAAKPRRYVVWGTIVALLFLAVLKSGLNLVEAPLYISDYENGTALIIGVAFAGPAPSPVMRRIDVTCSLRTLAFARSPK